MGRCKITKQHDDKILSLENVRVLPHWKSKKQHVSFLFQMIFFSESEVIKLWTIHNNQTSVFGSEALIFFNVIWFWFLTYIYIFSTIQNYIQVIEHNSLNEETGKNQFRFICCYI